VDARGLKILSTVLDLEANGTLHTNPVPLPFALSVQNTTYYGLDADLWQFPLTVGMTAVVSSQMNFSEDFRFFYGLQSTPLHTQGSLWWNATYTLEAQVAVDTPAGHFDAYRVRQAAPDGTYGLFYYAPATGNDARTEAYNGTTEVATSELAAYRYQALEPARFLGLTSTDWAIAGTAVAIVVGAIAIVWLRRRRHSRPPDSEANQPRT